MRWQWDLFDVQQDADCHNLRDVQKMHEINLTVPLNSTKKNVWVHDVIDFRNGNEPGTTDCESAMKIAFVFPSSSAEKGLEIKRVKCIYAAQRIML